MRFVWLFCMFVACGGTSDSGGGGSGTRAAGGGGTEAAPAGPVAKPAPTWCDGKKCPCKDGDEKAKESYKACELGAPLVVQGVPCGKGRVEFHPDGKLSRCTLEKPVHVGPYDCQVGIGILRLHPDGSLERCHVKGEYTVGSYKLSRPGNSFDFELYGPDKLKEGELSAPATFGDRSCEANKITLYRDGKVYSCTSAVPVKVDDSLTLDKGTPVLFGPDGALTGFFPQKEITFHGEVKKTGWAVCIVKDCNTIPD